jgi:hypothetical protein
VRAASKTFNVPVEFTSCVATGSFIDRGTDPLAPKCTTTSQSSIAIFIWRVSKILPFINSASFEIFCFKPDVVCS